MEKREPNEIQRLQEKLNKTKQQLDTCRREYKTLTQNIALGLYRRTPGPEGKLIMVNDALVQMFDYDSASELIEAPITNLYWTPSECIQFSSKMLANQQVIKQELKMKRRDGSPIWVAVTATVVRDTEGNPECFDGVMEDITDKKKAEEEAALQQKQLMQADKMISLGILVSGIAHEINNPNQFITSHLAPLKKCWKDVLPILDKYHSEMGDFLMAGRKYSVRRDQIDSMFSNMEKGSERIKNIVSELRDYAREQPFAMNETIEINSVVHSALALLGNLIKKSTNQFSVSYGKNIAPIMGDYQRLEQVLINIIQNSCQALPDKERAISVATYGDSEDHHVVVEVTDEGVGISEQDLKHVKDPFYTTKRERGGTGLGLSISNSIVEKHRGELLFSSKVGKGTTVKLMLPVQS